MDLEVVEIEQEIKNGQNMSSDDVRALKAALNKLGFYTPDFNKGITGETDKDFFEAIKNFQVSQMLGATGRVSPDDKTIRALNTELENPNNFTIFKRPYIWRTVGDKDVRGSHAARAGRQFSWDNPPEGGHPGEDFGCRCWAEPIIPMMPRGLNVSQSDLIGVVPLDGIKQFLPPELLVELGVIAGTGIGIGTILRGVLSKNIKLNKHQLKNLSRFIKKIPANSKNSVKIKKEKNGHIKFTTTSLGKVPGSKSVYQKTVNPEGKTIEFSKTTYDPKGKIVHIKDKLK